MNQKYNYRCGNCTKLLFKGDVLEGVVEIKCSKCGTISVTNSPLLTHAQRVLHQIKKELSGK